MYQQIIVMALRLFFDTETTGFSPTKNRIVSIALIVYDIDARRANDHIEEFYEIIKATDFRIEKWHKSTQIHGITQEISNAQGVSFARVISLLEDQLPNVVQIVGHNIEFDRAFLIAELMRAGRNDLVAILSTIPAYCTMRANTDNSRALKLTALYEKKFGHAFVGAHNALSDITATAEIYFNR